MSQPVYFDCICGARIRPACKSVHNNTQKHINFLKSEGMEVREQGPEWMNSRKAYQLEYNKKHSTPTYCDLCRTTVKLWKLHTTSKKHKINAERVADFFNVLQGIGWMVPEEK